MLNIILGIVLIVFTFLLLRQDAHGQLWTPGVVGIVMVLIAYWYFNRTPTGGKKR